MLKENMPLDLCLLIHKKMLAKQNYKRYYYPISSPPENETPESVMEIWDKFDTLPANVQFKVSDKSIAEKIERIGELFKLEPIRTGSIARAIRNYYFSEVKLENFPKIFVQEMKVDEQTAQKIAQMAIQQIIRDDSYEKAYLSHLLTVPFNEALRKYPKFGEQLITSGRIKIPNFPEPARPSIKNWITDYTSMFGYERNDPIKRNDYLFTSQNCRTMNQKDREKLSFILKSFEENNTISFNKDSGLLVFEKAMPAEETEKTKEGNLSFAYHQQMPFEKKSAPEMNSPTPSPVMSAASPVKAQSQVNTNNNPYLVKIPPKTAPTPKNVVNLKELM